MRYRTIVTSVLALFLVAGTARVSKAQDAVGAVKALYASAAYEDALAAIDRLRNTSAPETRNLDEYRAFCLLALGRQAEAETAMEALVKADPFFMPIEGEVSPRVRALFSTVRKRLLPGLLQEKYAMAKATFDRKEFAAAEEQFGRVQRLAEDPDMDQKAPGVADVRTLTAGFVELAHASAPPPMPAAAVPPEPMPEKPASPKKTVYDASDKQVTLPVVVRQDLPSWPNRPGLTMPTRGGVLEVLIDETGRVAQAAMRQSVSPVYDPLVLAAVAQWKYEPAKADGVPVRYRKMIRIEVTRRP
ncbi:MAG: energy transducer TonB [Bacteroidales bacterium]